jgi:hypothetical protein
MSLVPWLLLSAAYIAILIFYLGQLPMNLDVAWWWHISQRMADGARLYVDILEVNPPLAAYINLPAIWLARWTGLSGDLVLYGYYLSLSAGTLLICRSLLCRIFAASRPLVTRTLFFSLVFLFLILPLNLFGQREHLAVNLIMPYLLAAAARSLGRPVPPGLALAVGLLAGIGFSFKPFFLLVWVVIELYLGAVVRLPASWKRREVLAAAAIMGLYGLGVILGQPHYLAVFSIVGRVYWAYNNPWAYVLDNAATLMWLGGWIPFFLVKLPPEETRAFRVIFWAATGFLITAWIQKKGWPNHLFPCLALTGFYCILVVVRKLEILNGVRGLKVGAAVLFTGLVFLSLHLTLQDYREFKRGPLPPLIALVREQAPGQPIFILSTHLSPAFPLVTQAGAAWPYRLGLLWTLPALYRTGRQVQPNGLFQPRKDLEDVARFTLDVVVTDLLIRPPALLLVDQRPWKVGMGPVEFDFMAYFAQDPRFAGLRRDYRYLTKVDDFLVYEREPRAGK